MNEVNPEHWKLSSNIAFRLMLIQVIELIHNDNFLLRHNVSVTTENFLSFAGDFPPFFYSISGERPETGTVKLENLRANWRNWFIQRQWRIFLADGAGATALTLPMLQTLSIFQSMMNNAIKNSSPHKIYLKFLFKSFTGF